MNDTQQQTHMKIMSVATVDRRMHVVLATFRIQHLRTKSHEKECKKGFPPSRRRQESKHDVSHGKPGSVKTHTR